ncbi:MAG: DUF1513 domain-containing protein [Pseudomonadota bacterium]
MVTEALSRRDFIAVAIAGTSLFATTGSSALTECKRTSVAYIATAKLDDDYVAVFLDHDVNPLFVRKLPQRGHGTAIDINTGRTVVFARRHGKYFSAYQLHDAAPTATTVEVQSHRRFYGHGAFGADSRYLYVTENDFDNGRGCIGCYDAENGYRRVGEWSSYGIGPHELVSIPGTNLVVIANGGIQTHPESGRKKLNTETMQPSLALVDVSSGACVGKHVLHDDLHQVSIRHLAVHNGVVWFGCQYEGNGIPTEGLIGRVNINQTISSYNGGRSRLGLVLPRLPDHVASNTLGYISSVAVDSHRVMFTSSRGGFAFALSRDTVNILEENDIETALMIDCSGIAAKVIDAEQPATELLCYTERTAGFVMSSGTGELALSDAEDDDF